MPLRTKCVTVLLLILCLGLHWALLQTVAWTGMLVSYSRDGSLTEAIHKTFDGQHPCSLCRLVQSGKAAEKETEKTTPQTKLDWAALWHGHAFVLPASTDRIASADRKARTLGFPPPTPPPRAAFPGGTAIL